MVSEKWSKPHGSMDLEREEETIIVAGALTSVALDYAPIDIFAIDRIGISSQSTTSHYGTSVETYPGTDVPLDDTTVQFAQSFKSGADEVNSVKLYIEPSSDFDGTLRVAIYSDDGGVDTIVGTAATKDEDALTLDTKYLETFTFTDVTVSDDTTYWIVIDLSAVSAGKVEVYGNANDSSVYADGNAAIEPDGAGWDSYTDGDIWFRIDHDAVAIDDSDVSAIVQKYATDGEVTLGSSEDDNALYRVTYTTLVEKDLDSYLDTYTSFYPIDHVINAIGADPKRFWFTLGMLVQKGNVELSHGLVQNDPSGGATSTSAERTIKNICIDLENLYVKGA